MLVSQLIAVKSKLSFTLNQKINKLWLIESCKPLHVIFLYPSNIERKIPVNTAGVLRCSCNEATTKI